MLARARLCRIPRARTRFRPSIALPTRALRLFSDPLPSFPALPLVAGVAFGCVGLIFHEIRPFKNQSTFAMDRETVEFARAVDAEAKIQADRALKKKA
jgi:hypothetical protein